MLLLSNLLLFFVKNLDVFVIVVVDLFVDVFDVVKDLDVVVGFVL